MTGSYVSVAGGREACILLPDGVYDGAAKWQTRRLVARR